MAVDPKVSIIAASSVIACGFRRLQSTIRDAAAGLSRRAWPERRQVGVRQHHQGGLIVECHRSIVEIHRSHR
jgi:hypothetical protein